MMMDATRVVSPSVLWVLLLCLTAVAAQPRIDIAPQTTTVVARGTVILRCRVSNKGMYTVNWIKFNKVISNDDSIVPVAVPSTRYSIVGDPNQGNYSLKITDILLSDGASFRCQLRAPASGGEDIVSDPATLIVQHPPAEGYPQCSPDYQSFTGLQVGQQVNFFCSTERGEPAAHLNWTLDGAEIPAKLTESTPGFIGLNFARNVTTEDDGRVFICILTHDLLPEPRTCQVGPLDVIFPPVKTTIKPTPRVPKEGRTLLLVCEAFANPILDMTYTWFVTPPTPEIGERQVSRVSRLQGSIWVLGDVTHEDEGTVVVCEARNNLGALNASFTIDVFKKTTPPPRPTPPLVVPTRGQPPVTAAPKSGVLTTPYVIILILIAVALLLLTIALVIFVVKRKKQPSTAVITVTDLDNMHADVHSLASFGNISRHGTPYLDRVDYELNRSRSHSRDMFDSVSLDSASALVRLQSRESPTRRKQSVDSLGKPLRYDQNHREYRSPSNGSPTHRPAKRLDSSPIKERKLSESAHSQAGRPLPKITEPVQQNEYAEVTPVAVRKKYNESQLSVTSPESGFGEDDVLIKPLNGAYPSQSSNNCNCSRKMSHVEGDIYQAEARDQQAAFSFLSPLYFLYFARPVVLRSGRMLFFLLVSLATSPLVFAVADTPKFVLQPRDTSVIYGETVTLYCSVSGEEGAQFVWIKDGSVITRGFSILTTDSHRFSIGVTGTGSYNLVITDAQAGDSGSYRCVVTTGGTGLISNTANLQVWSPPVVEYPTCSGAGSNEVAVGETVTLSCDVEGGNPKVQLFLNKGDVAVETRETTTGISYDWTVTESDEAAEFVCIGTHRFWAEPRTCRFGPFHLVHGPPSLNLVPAETTIQAGQSVSFLCSAESAPRASYTWLVGGEEVDSNGGSTARMTVHEVGSSSILLVRDVGNEDQSLQIMCVVSSATGTMSAGAVVHVEPVYTAVTGPPPTQEPSSKDNDSDQADSDTTNDRTSAERNDENDNIADDEPEIYKPANINLVVGGAVAGVGGLLILVIVIALIFRRGRASRSRASRSTEKLAVGAQDDSDVYFRSRFVGIARSWLFPVHRDTQKGMAASMASQQNHREFPDFLADMLRRWTVMVWLVLGSVRMTTQALTWIIRPVDVLVFEGQPVTLSCGINYALTGYDNHHWVRLDPKSDQQSFLTEGKYISAALSADKRRRYSVTAQTSASGYTLRMNDATKADSGLYGCLVYSRTNVNRRSLSNFARVKVVPRALPTGTPLCKVEPPHPQPGTSVQFSCSSTVDGSITSLSWSLSGEQVVANSVLASERSSITFRKTLGDMDNQAVYTCTERWPATGGQQASCSIVPFDMPVNVSVIPLRVQVVSGEPVTFTCHAESVPPATSYMWYYEGHPVVERPDLFEVLNDGRKMKIFRVVGEDFSKYTVRCKVKNMLAMKRSATAFLDVIPLSQRNAMLEKKLKNQSIDHSRNTSNAEGDSHVRLQPGGVYDRTLVTVLIALTASVGTAILLVLAMVLIACLRRPIKRRLSSTGESDQQPLHVSSFPMNEVTSAAGSSTKAGKNRNGKRRPLSSSSYQPLQRDFSVSGGSPITKKKTMPVRKISLPAIPQKHIKSVSLYENATPLRLSLSEGLDRERGSKSSRKGPFAPVSI
ncbi:uncharacterized protein LOC110978839 [Acanthaster planci]|uniref:Uncharacterized protein LOC110978839 n=1 Tax=Acanthaster planci TaxID=133434 RepID=A0A8B7Y999_ACAPL|nr:uncharacterized protein LOC110978839 [Acanthaster planci]